jgi:hypothetical protein
MHLQDYERYPSHHNWKAGWKAIQNELGLAYYSTKLQGRLAAQAAPTPC